MQTAEQNPEVSAARAMAAALWGKREPVSEEHRTQVFAQAFVDELARCMATLPATAQQSIEGGNGAAEALNQSPMQAITEFLQNADDVRATQVRIARIEHEGAPHLLLVHNGQPVRAQDVLGMTMPFVSTKTQREDQRGKFGIGLKTLRRIAHPITVHGAPFHFRMDFLTFGNAAPLQAIPGLYDPATDTAVLGRLKTDISSARLAEWFANKAHDWLPFLSSLKRVTLCDADGAYVDEHVLDWSDWADFPVARQGSITGMLRRSAIADGASITVWRATLTVPENIAPSLKIKPRIVNISVALHEPNIAGSIYVGFRTQIPCNLAFSLDAPFEPDTSREGLIESDWNGWLIAQCGDVLATLACALLAADPLRGWGVIPLEGEWVKTTGAADWLSNAFAQAFEQARRNIAEFDPWVNGLARLSQLSYEAEELTEVLQEHQLGLLAPNRTPLPAALRDANGYWRVVLDAMAVSWRADVSELLEGFTANCFINEDASWWVRAGCAIAEAYADTDYGSAPPAATFLLSANGTPLVPPSKSAANLLLLDAQPSTFARYWNLHKYLHTAYLERSNVLLDWLSRNAAFARTADANADLLAFAELYRATPKHLTDEELCALRDRFDLVNPELADATGRTVGQAVLLDGYRFGEGKATKRSPGRKAGAAKSAAPKEVGIGREQIVEPVSPLNAYLSKTLDGANGYWPEAAVDTPGLTWLAARYEKVLRVSEERRGRPGNVDSRGPRRFLHLLGAESAPRLKSFGEDAFARSLRAQDLAKVGCRLVPDDLVSPDLLLVLRDMENDNKARRKDRSAALIKTFARVWERTYMERMTVGAVRRRGAWPNDRVRARWLLDLIELPWVALRSGSFVSPTDAVLRTRQTESLYATTQFLHGLDRDEIKQSAFTQALGFITDRRASDIVAELVALRRESKTDAGAAMRCYRNLASQIVAKAGTTHIGDMSVASLANAFEVDSLILAAGIWRGPSYVFSGPDIFHAPDRFVPASRSLEPLWRVLQVRAPEIPDCVAQCRLLTAREYDQGVLIDLYRYMEAKLGLVERRVRDLLRRMPLYTGRAWVRERPVYFVADVEQRQQLRQQKPFLPLWEPPCDETELKELMSAAQIQVLKPDMTVLDDSRAALARAGHYRGQFEAAISFLCNELARYAPSARQSMCIDIDALLAVPLYVHQEAFAVRASADELADDAVLMLHALVQAGRKGIHLAESALGARDYGGQAIAAFFAPQYRHQVSCIWYMAWNESRGQEQLPIRLAADAELASRIQEEAQRIEDNVTQNGMVKLNARVRPKAPEVEIRMLKDVDQVLSSMVVQSEPQRRLSAGSAMPGKLLDKAPSPKTGGKSGQPGTDATISSNKISRPGYNKLELEDHGWRFVRHVLDNSNDPAISDMRARRAIGADGHINWKTFVELKATAGGPQTEIKLYKSEYERAAERAKDFILATVSGLEQGSDAIEVRLIFDPLRTAVVRPISDVTVTGLDEATAVRLTFTNAPSVAALDSSQVDQIVPNVTSNG